MRIAIVAGPYYPVPPLKYGGTERVIYYLIKGLKELGHEPIFLGPGDSKVDCELIPIVDKAIYFPKSDSPAFQKSVKNALQKTTSELKRVAKSVDVIHSHDFDMKDFNRYPNLTTIHGHIGFENVAFYEARRTLAYVTISKNQQAAFPDLNYIGVVYNGEDPSDFPVVSEPQDYLCFIGRFDWDKSPHLAIQLAINLKMKIKLAGKVDLEGADYFKNQIKPYLKHPLVEFLGEIDSSQRNELVGHARCNLHPLLGRREPFGLTVIEAAYCGTPTLAIARGSMPELIREGKTGMLVEDFVEGYSQIKACFKMDREYIARRTRRHFNYKKMTEGYLKAYKKVLREFDKNKK